MNQRFTQLGLVSLAIVAGLPASAQTTTTGALVGTVKDSKGLPVAGASIRITSAQISRTLVVGADGSFRLPLLNPGSMDITITKAGFTTINQKVDVSINETKTLNFKMVAEAEVTVVVAATLVGIDTETAQTGSNFSMDTIKSIPLGRSMESLTFLAPGVASSNMGSSLFGASIAGASGAENAYIIDGVNTTDPRYGGSGTSMLTDFIDQVEIQTGGFKPEYSALGGVVNVVTKSGSNQFKGSSWFTWDPRGLFASPKRDTWVNQANAQSRYDIGAEVSGPLIKDRLFYFVGISGQFFKVPESSTNATGNTGSSVEDTTQQFVGKLNWFITPDLQLTFFGSYSPFTHRNDKDVPRFGDGNIAFKQDSSSQSWNATMDWTATSNLVVSAKVGEFSNSNEVSPMDPAPSVADYAYMDGGPGNFPGLAGQNYRRGGGSYNEVSDSKSRQAKVDVSLFLGSHQLKAGLSITDKRFEQNSWIGIAPTSTAFADSNGQISIWDENTIAFTQEAFLDAVSKGRNIGIYLQDTWEVLPGLKASYGVRAEKQTLTDSNGADYLSFDLKDQVEPRVGIIWDMNNDGQSKFTLNYAKYHETFPLRYGLRYRGGRYIYWYSERYSLDYNTTNGTYTYGPFDPANGDWVDDYAGPYNDPPVMHDIKPPERTEWVVGYDRNLPAGWSVGIHGKHRELKNAVEDMTPVSATGRPVDLGNVGWGQAILGNPRPGIISWTTNSNSQSNVVTGQSQTLSWDSTFPEAFNIYQSVDLTVQHKTERNYLNMSYTWSRLYGTYEGVVSAGNQQVDTNGTASFDYPILVGRGPLSLDRTHALKVIGSRSIPLGPGTLNLGYQWTYQSGTPLSQMTSYNRQTTPIGNWTLPPDQIPVDYAGYRGGIPVDFRFGQFGRSPANSVINLRVEYVAKIGRFEILPSLDIFNAGNSRAATGLASNLTLNATGSRRNAGWGKPTGYLQGRSFRAGVKIRF